MQFYSKTLSFTFSLFDQVKIHGFNLRSSVIFESLNIQRGLKFSLLKYTQNPAIFYEYLLEKKKGNIYEKIKIQMKILQSAEQYDPIRNIKQTAFIDKKPSIDIKRVKIKSCQGRERRKEKKKEKGSCSKVRKIVRKSEEPR